MLPENRPKVAFYTFGCKVNLFETDQLKKSLTSVEIVENDADIYVVNGCTVTAATDRQVRNMIRRFSRKGRVFVTGCYARKSDPALEQIDNVEFFKNIEDVANYFGNNFVYDAAFSRSRPFIKIQSGCDQFCTYCIIPYVRGPLKSVPLKKIETLLKKIESDGFNEVVLTGIHIGKYGYDLNTDNSLADVVEVAYKSVGRVRLGSLESPEIDERLFEMAKDGKILPHWHIPLQSGSNSVLKRMNRPYTAEGFAKAVERVTKSYDSHPAIGTDIIAGFPGETEEEFLETVEFVRSMPFTYGHVFPFSPREGTKAWDMEKNDPVSPPVKKERAGMLRQIFEEKKQNFIKTLVGTFTQVVVEEKNSDGLWTSTSSNFQTVMLKGDLKSGELVTVRLELTDSGNLEGNPVAD